MRKYVSLSGLALIVACGGSSPRRGDEDSDRRADMGQRDNCPADSGNSGKEGDMYKLENCDSGTDSSVDMNGSLDDAMIDMGNSDGNNDMGSDGPGDMGLPDEGTTYPIARLNCEERNEEGLCVHRMRVGRVYEVDASPSEAAPGRSLVNYRVYTCTPCSDNYFERATSLIRVAYGVTSEEREFSDGFPAELEVTDNEGDSARLEMRNIVTD